MITLILAGCSGTRFWPLSQENYPKQFLTLFSGKSMIRLTFERALLFSQVKDIFIITIQEQKELIKKHLPELKDFQIIIEPSGRNTAPCIAYSVLYLKNYFALEQNLVILPADHYIPEHDLFKETMFKAEKEILQQDLLLIFGISPTFPATGYGYIEIDAQNHQSVFHVKHFKEKPDLETAIKYLNSGNYFWNSGMISSSLGFLLKSFENHAPEILESANKVLLEENILQKRELYSRINKQPFDIAILEKSENVFMLPISYQWSDVGKWASYSDLIPKNNDHNFPLNTISINSKNNFSNTVKQLALIDVDNLIIIETEDSILISKRESVEKVKEVVELIKMSNS